MTEKNIREKYRLLLGDLDFDKLDLELKTPNIFEILGVSRTEIRHSNFLSWLLDPNGTHGLGKIFLIKFLRDLAISDIAKGLDEFKIEELNFNNVELRREWMKIDLLIIFDTVVICIENKIDSKDHSEQLSKYRKIVDGTFDSNIFNKVFVYLSPSGEEPNESSEKEFYVPYSYETIIDQIDSVLKIHGNSMNTIVNQYIFDYVTTIKREIMKNDALNELAIRVYKNHRELFDFIFKHKSDILPELLLIFEDKIKESNWIPLTKRSKGRARFLTSKLKDIIPRKGNIVEECFLFEIDFHLFPNVVFKTLIPDGTPSEIGEYLKGLLYGIEGSKSPKGKKWLVHFSHNWKFPKDMTEVDETEVLKILGENWSEISEIVRKVENALIENRTELQKYSK